MNTKIFLTAILMVSFPLAYAETSTVEVPFDSHGQSCWFDELAIEYHCTWQGIQEKFTIQDLEEFRDILDETVYNEELKRLQEEALAEIEAEKAILTTNELKILELETKINRGTATATDSVLMNLLKDLETCQQGMDRQTAPFQNAREFEISEFNLWSVNNVKYDGQLGEIVMAIEECRAQEALKWTVGMGYYNMPTGDMDYNFSLQDHYTPDVKAVPYEKLTSTTTDIDRSAICDNNQFAQSHKAQFGCEVLYDGKTLEQIKAENELRFGTDGKIGYNSEALDKYYDFMEQYGNKYATAEDKYNQALIAEPIIQEMFDDNLFYERNSED